MDRAFEVILAAVHRYEGTINQFLGDGVMALFGAPIAHEDHAAARAARGAGHPGGLEPLRADVQRTHGRRVPHAHRHQHRARGGRRHRPRPADGLHGHGRHREPGRAPPERRPARPDRGQPAHPAARARASSSSRISASSRSRARASRCAPTPCSGEIRGRTRLEVSRERGLTPLVGRDAELAAAASDASGAPRDGAGGVVLIAGDAGRRQVPPAVRVPAAACEARWHLELETTCASYGHAMAYRPVVELYRRYLDLPEGLTPEEIRGASPSSWSARSRGRGAAHPARSLPRAPAPPEFLLRLQGAQLKERTNDLLARGDRRERSERAPVVLVVENVHWIDASSEDFLKLLAGRVPDHASCWS